MRLIPGSTQHIHRACITRRIPQSMFLRTGTTALASARHWFTLQQEGGQSFLKPAPSALPKNVLSADQTLAKCLSVDLKYHSDMHAVSSTAHKHQVDGRCL